MAVVDGHRSVFPGAIDDWGTAFVNDVCNNVDAEFFNKIEDAVLNTEIHTRRSFITGINGILTNPVSGAARPHIMFKSYSVVFAGPSAVTTNLVVPGPAFTTTEKALFGGFPFASGSIVNVQVRIATGEATHAFSYHGGLIQPADTSGDSGFTVVASTARHGNGDFTIGAGTFVISLLITSN